MPWMYIRKYEPHWGSHIPTLIKLLEITSGPVLELGLGIFSTPLLHNMCKVMGRKLVSYDNDKNWVDMHSRFIKDDHEVYFVDNWDDAKIDDTQWSVVLVDHGPSERRAVDTLRLKDNADYIALHDSDGRFEKHYGYSKVYPLFKHVKASGGDFRPKTTVLSDKFDLKDLDI